MTESEPERRDADEASEQKAFSRAFKRLCHVAALTRDHRQQEAIDQLVLTVLAVDANVDPEPRALIEAIEAYFGLEVSRANVGEAIARLTSTRDLIPGPSGKLGVARERKQAVEQRAQDAQALETQVREDWVRALRARIGEEIPEGPLWNAVQYFLALAFREHGAETVHLLKPPEGGGGEPKSLEAFIVEAGKHSGLDNRLALVRLGLEVFFNETSETRTRYLAQLLDSTFTFFALSLDEETASVLRGSLPPVAVFLDTNFIFGLLDLHDSRLADVSKELINGINSGQLQFKLYYHERTQREIDEVLFAIGSRLKSRPWPKALSRAAISAGTLSSIELKYHQLNAQSHVDASVFMSRYESFATTLQELGVQLFREQESEGEAKERWTLAAEFEAQVRIWRPDRPRRYEAADHDAALLLSVSRRRRGDRASLASGALILTADYLLHRFDRHLSFRNRVSSSTVLPAQLLQLIRPFLPATKDFDRRFVESFTIPEFRSLVGGYAETASKVLSYLATFADVPEETATKLLRDEILMRTLGDKPESSPEFRESVDSALVANNAKLVETNAALAAQIDADRARHGVELEDLKARLNAQEAETARLREVATTAMGLAAGTKDSAISRVPQSRVLEIQIPAIALTVVLVIIDLALLAAVVWFAGELRAGSIDDLIGNTAKAALGGIGASSTVLSFLVFWNGVIRAAPDFLARSLTSKAMAAILLVAILGVAAAIWGIQV